MSEFEVLLRTSGSRRVVRIEPSVLIQRGVCDKGNSKQVARFIIAYLLLLEDSPLHSTSGPKPNKVVNSFITELTSKPILETVVKYSTIGDRLISYPEVTETGFNKGPRAVPNNSIISKEYIEWAKSGDAKIFEFMLSFLWFGKKMAYESEEFYSTALRKWEDVEDKLASLQLPVDLHVLSGIVKGLLPRLQSDVLAPKFGPGYVSERGVHGVIQKTDIKFDAKLDRVLFRNCVFVTDTMKESGGFRPDKVIPSYDRWSPSSEHSIQNSRLKFVPKNVKTARSICMEPNAYMYAQQAVLDMVKLSLDHSSLSHFIDLRDQTRNQYLAEYGSLTNRIDTIDLSSASDSVSVELVRAIFPRDWLYYLLGTRTSRVEMPDGTLRSVLKFAPMGSALCFPIQCIIFTCVCLQAAMYYVYGREVLIQEGVKDWQLRDILSSFNNLPNLTKGFMPLAVYGDDICVDSKLTPYVTELLAGYGFSVNLDKSFTGLKAFRESCGKYYLGGEDVTPLFYKLPMFGDRMDASDVSAVIGQCNYAYSKSYRTLRRYFLKEVLLARGYSLKFTSDENDASGLMSPGPHLNYHLKRRWNVGYQRFEVRHQMAAVLDYEEPATPGEEERVDQYQYLQWFRAARYSGDDSFKQAARRGVPANTRVVWRWTPDTN